jgi:hypothetical protein
MMDIFNKTQRIIKKNKEKFSCQNKVRRQVFVIIKQSTKSRREIRRCILNILKRKQIEHKRTYLNNQPLFYLWVKS